MRLVLAKNWWALVLRGVIGMLVGVVTFAWPGVTLGAFVLLFAAYALLGGIVSIIGAVRAAGARDKWGILVVEGLAGIATAVITVAWPAITTLMLIYVIAGWALVTGVFEIVAAVRLRKHIAGEWLLALAGAASIIFGMLIAIAPLAGAFVIALWFGAYAFVFGAILVVLGFRLRTWRDTQPFGAPMAIHSH